MRFLPLLLASAVLTGCSSMKFWESDEVDELAPAELIDLEDDKVNIDKVWSRSLGAGQKGFSSNINPTLKDGILYGADPDGLVMAVNAVDGAVVWKQKLKRDISGGVGVGGGMVLAASLEGGVYAMDASSGDLKWRVKIGNEVMSAPVSNGEVVVVQTLDGYLIGLTAAEGREIWRYRADIPTLTLRSGASPVMTTTTVIAGFANGKLVALNPSNGAAMWEARIALPKGRSELERMVDISSPVLKDDVVFVTSFQGRAVALSRGTGRSLWQQDVSSYQPPGVGDDAVFVTQANDEVKALSSNSGQVSWDNVKMTYRQLTAPAYAKGYVAVGDAEGYLHVLSATDGEYLGRRKVDGSGLRLPLISDGQLIYVLDNSGDLTAFDITGL